MSDEDVKAVAETASPRAQATPAPAPAQGSGETFRSLCLTHRVSRRYAGALRIALGLKREPQNVYGKPPVASDFDKPLDPAKFIAALKTLKREA